MVTFFLVILLNVMIVSSTHRHVKGALSDLITFLETENPLKMLFVLPQKLFLFSIYSKVCLAALVMYKNGFIRKVRLISNFMTSQPG